VVRLSHVGAALGHILLSCQTNRDRSRRLAGPQLRHVSFEVALSVDKS
jgi:hypothetical protein